MEKCELTGWAGRSLKHLSTLLQALQTLSTSLGKGPPLNPPLIPGVGKHVILGLPAYSSGESVRIAKTSVAASPTASRHYRATLVGWGEGEKRWRPEV